MKGSSHGSSSLTFPRGREMASRLDETRSQFLASSEPKREWDPGLILRVSPKLLDLSSTAIQTSVTSELDEPGAKRGTRRERAPRTNTPSSLPPSLGHAHGDHDATLHFIQGRSDSEIRSVCVTPLVSQNLGQIRHPLHSERPNIPKDGLFGRRNWWNIPVADYSTLIFPYHVINRIIPLLGEINQNIPAFVGIFRQLFW